MGRVLVRGTIFRRIAFQLTFEKVTLLHRPSLVSTTNLALIGPLFWDKSMRDIFILNFENNLPKISFSSTAFISNRIT